MLEDYKGTTSGNKKEFNFSANFVTPSVEYFNYFMNEVRAVHADVAKSEFSQLGVEKKNYTVMIDGKVSKFGDEDKVKNFGTITYSPFSSAEFGPLLKETYKLLFDTSAVGRTGDYKNEGHLLLLNGKVFATSYQDFILKEKSLVLREGDIITFANLLPYARKLELMGVTNGARFTRVGQSAKKIKVGKVRVSFQVRKPNGTYFLAANLLKKKYSKTPVEILFKFISGGTLGIGNSPYFSGNDVQKFRGSFKGVGGRPYVYPAIYLRFGRTQ
jgi:hypothetical protein